MTKMEDEETSGGESTADVPSFDLTAIPPSEGGIHFSTEKCHVQTPKSLESPTICAECNKLILDKYYMKVDGRLWHEKCVKCTSCEGSLSDSCYVKNKKFYCKECYRRLQYCHRCSGTFSGDDLVMRVGSDPYHVHCFSCNYCARQLHVGDKFYSLHEATSRKICCKICYDMDDVSNLRTTETDSEDSASEMEALSPPLTSPGSNHGLLTSQTPSSFGLQISGYNPGLPPLHLQSTDSTSAPSSMTSPNSKRGKRPRTILTTEQRKKFKASFEISQKPCRKVRETLASETGLTARVVQVWFQNQRAKIKKITRQESQGEEGTSKRGRKRRDPDSDSESEVPSSPGSYTSTSTLHQAQICSEYQSPESGQSISGQEKSVLRVLSPIYQQTNQTSDSALSPQAMECGQLSHPSPRIDTLQLVHKINATRDVMQPHNEKMIFENANFLFEPMQDSTATQSLFEPEEMSLGQPSGGAMQSGPNPIDSLVYMQNSFFSNA